MVREAASRALGLRHHDEQIMGGAALQLGKLAEMRTGEGKTLTATLPACFAALTGRPVHVMTANDYLATRDANWMRPAYEFLGLSVGLLDPAPNPDRSARRDAYAADITYGRCEEFCYDFLRDNAAWDLSECVQRGLGTAIVDEADLILIDQMRATPSISGPADHVEDRHEHVARAVAQLTPGTDFTADLAGWTAVLSDTGIAKLEDLFGAANLYDDANHGLAYLAETAVRARALLERDRDYIVDGDEVRVLDRTSGRPLQSRYGEGMHEALEAKEGLPVQPARQTLATISTHDYLRQYDVLCGMTGTATSETPIYHGIYSLDVTVIPTHRPVIRIDRPDLLYRTRQAKLTALAADARRRAATGQPVLIGAMAVADAEVVAGLLADAGVAHELLSARNFEREATVIAEAGRPGAITIVVKMAGRGVDIVLGGSSGADREAVADLGGLCVLGTERGGDRRTELHLRGRAGRQGDPGESVFYLSAEDELTGQILPGIAKALATEGVPFPMLSHQLDKAQLKAAAWQAQWYKASVAFDDVLGAQQRAFYAERRTVLLQADPSSHVAAMLDEVLTKEVSSGLRAGGKPEALLLRLAGLFPLARTPTGPDNVLRAMSGPEQGRLARVLTAVRREAREAYENREAQLGPQIMRELERRALLSACDRAWRGHLAAMADLYTTALIRAAGRTPALAEYQSAAADLYEQMTQQVREQVIGSLFFAKIRLGPSSGSQRDDAVH